MKQIQLKMQEQFAKMCATGKLFRSEATGLWNTYLSAFPTKYRNVFRDPESTEHNCNNCHNFIRRYGNIVAIDESGNLMTLFDIAAETKDEEYKASMVAFRDTIRASKIKDVFFETFAELNATNYEACKKGQAQYKLGIAENHKKYNQEEADKFGKVDTETIYTFNHFSLNIPGEFVNQSGKSIESIMAGYRDKYQVFKRGMEEIPVDTLMLVRDLISQGSLLNGDSYVHDLSPLIDLMNSYANTSWDKDLWCWNTSFSLPERVAKFRNTLLGTLCVELSQGEELNKACLNWNKRADPVNYMKATAPITQKQIKEAQKFVEENGYADSFDRRLATIDDIKASEILHLNSGDGKIKTASVFDNVKATATRHKRAEFDKVEEVAIEKFMKDILPTATGLEVYVENRLQGNFCTLTKSVDDNSKNIFKYGNNYSKTFNGNLAGKSQIKEAVESLGGKTDGVLRFSIMWAEDNIDDSDLDAHCIEPDRTHIYYGDKVSFTTGGNLDIDITQPQSHKKAKNKDVVENITYPDLSRIKDGVYRFFVHQWSARNSKGFKAEIEFNGELYSYVYNKAVSGNVQVAEVTLKNGEFTIAHKLPLAEGSSKDREIWGVNTNNFHKVNLVCLSPNYWGDSAVGNKHYMFMLEGCKVDIPVRGFHNEDLSADLLEHRKVMEVLGTTAMIEPTDKQLSGLGFNATVRDEVVVKVKGSHQRVLKVKF